MISSASVEGRKRLGLGFDMEETELEEGEACYYQNDDDSAIDPDVALSYIDEKLQDVLGHFQKDFEVGDSAEMSGQKFNGYGSFLPTYKRYPAASLPKTPAKVLNYSPLRSPNNFHPEGGRQNLLLQSNSSVTARLTPASLNTVPLTAAKAPFVNDSFPSSSHAEEYPSRIESTKSAHSVDQKNLKVRIRIKPDKLLTRKKAEIYSGLGLDVSPSSSLEGSLVDSDGVSHEPLAAPYESPTSILQAITSVPEDRLLSPLPNDLIYMIESAKFRRMKVSVEHKHKISEENIILRDLKDDNCNFSNDEAQNSINVLPKKETDTYMLGCDDIVSNALRLPLLSNVHSNTGDSTKVNTSRKKSKGRKNIGAKPKNEEEDSKKDVYRDLFGEIKSDNGEDSKASDDTAHTVVKPEKGRPSKFRGGSRERERSDIKKSQISESSRTRVSSCVDGTVAPPVVKQDWVCCDKCQKWRLLPLGTNPSSLPEKWLCSMLYWLPGLNRCSIPEEETTKALESVPAPVSQSGRHDHANSMQSRLSSDNERISDQYQQDLGLLVSKETKKETEDVPNTNNLDLSHLSNSTRRNVMESVKYRSINGDSRSPSVSEKKKVSESHSGGGGDALNSKIRIKREAEQDVTGASKKIKIDDLDKSDEDRTSNHILKVDRSRSSSLSTVDLAKDSKHHSKRSIVNPQDQMQIISEDRETEKKRNGNIFQDTLINTDVEENILKRGKKARLYKSSGEETDNQGTKDEKNEPQLSLDAIGSLKREIGSVSSSSKVSSSHNKEKAKQQEVKGSPVESVSSSPLRVSNPDNNFTSTVPKMESQVGSNSRKHSIGVKDEERGSKNHVSTDKANDDKGNKNNQDHHHHHVNGSHSRKSGKGSSSRSKDKSKSGSRSDKGNNHKRSDSSKEAGKNNKVEEKSAVNSDKVEKVAVPKKDFKEKETNCRTRDDSDAKVDRTRAKSHSLPPSGRETSRWPQSISVKENGANHTSSAENISEGQKQIVKKGENQNGVIKSKSAMTSNGGVKIKRDVVEAPSPIRKDPSNQAASKAIKEAKDLKHLADRLKNSGSNAESTGLYFQAALKFLHGASLLKSCNSESGKHGEMIQSIQVYSSTAKLCEFCAHEYEKLKDMAAAALAYKCTEVAYFRVIYSSHGNASRDRNILQTSLQIAPPGESPSSSASDIENLNNSATMVEKSAATAALAKGIASPQVAGNHVIPVRNRPSLLRLLNFTQEVNFAMEASRKSRIAFAAASIKLEEIKHKEGISSVQKALDFNFQDVEGLLHMVRVAMEIINR